MSDYCFSPVAGIKVVESTNRGALIDLGFVSVPLPGLRSWKDQDF